MPLPEPDLKDLIIPKGGIKRVLKRIPVLLYVMLAGLMMVNVVIFSKLAAYLVDPKPLKEQADYALLLALVMVLPLCLIGLFGLAYGLVAYQIYKQDRTNK